MTFEDLNLSKPLKNAVQDLGFDTPTPIQVDAFSPILSGKDLIGIAQTGTGKTLAYLLPLLRNLSYSEQKHPRILIVVPTRELAVQVAHEAEQLCAYMNVRIKAVYGGVNINTQAIEFEEGADVVVSTPGRLYDLVLNRAISLKKVQHFVIDEVDEILEQGFRHQLVSLLELLPEKRQNLMFSATMTTEVKEILDDFFYEPIVIETAPTGTPVENIEQLIYEAPNFFTKLNLLKHLLSEHAEDMKKVLVFAASKKQADIAHEKLDMVYPEQVGVIHSNKSQNYRLGVVDALQNGEYRIVVTTDIMARGIDVSDITHVINLNIPDVAENYMHRIGRTGRANNSGKAISFCTKDEKEYLKVVEDLMGMKVPLNKLPSNVEISEDLLYEEQPKSASKNLSTGSDHTPSGDAFHAKKEKNSKVNQGGSYRRKIKAKYKKPKTRGQKRKK